MLILLTANTPVTSAMPEPIIIESMIGSSIGDEDSFPQFGPRHRCFRISISEHFSGFIPSVLHSSSCSGVAREVELGLYNWAEVIVEAVTMPITRIRIDHATDNVTN